MIDEQNPNEASKPSLAENHFCIACIKVRSQGAIGIQMYSHCDLAPETYNHGVFVDVDEALYSIEMRCEQIGLRFTRAYARNLIIQSLPRC